MSLNGLDDAKIKEAHEAAVAEPGGWFLLKYAARDEVELLGRGNGGIVEIRNAIAQFEETSPLFGFLRYRRRNVILKYLPDDCSRLVQARATVHFNSVCDRFAPYDTTFSIAAAKELKDTKLSAACSLHAASGSTSSSTSSLRRRRLMEIAEEEEEEQRASKRQSVVKEEDRPPSSHERGDDQATTTAPPLALNSDLARSLDQSNFAGTTDPPAFVGVRPPSPAKSLDAVRRTLHSTARPDLYSYSSYSSARPKIKLGPRPSLDISGRPRTSSGTNTYRPISTIPAGFKLFAKGSKKGKAVDGSSDAQIKEETSEPGPFLTSSASITDCPPASPALPRPHTSGGRPPPSSALSLKAPLPPIIPAAKQNTITPEKARLKKAMQLREKKRKMDAQPAGTIPVLDVVDMPVTPGESAIEDTAADQPDLLLAGGERDAENRSSISKADSGIDVGSAGAMDQASVHTQTDSHPASPMAMSLELVDSTKASSLSESTDETIQALREAKSEEEVADLEAAPAGPAAVEGASEAGEDSDDDDSGSAQEEDLTTAAETAVRENEELSTPESAAALPLSRFASLPAARDGGSSGVQQNREEEVPEELPATPQLRIPTSKFSTQDLRSQQMSPLSRLGSDSVVIEPVTQPRLVVEGSEADTASIETIETKRSKRKAMIEPIRTDLDIPSDKEAVRSEAGFSDDEDLMEELQSATVQQAQPIIVSKSPIAPVFPSLSPQKQAGGSSPTPRVVRTVSNPVRGPLLAPGDASAGPARTVSSGSAFLHKITQQTSPSALAPKKTNLGSSISQRIKALEKLSASGAAAGEAQQRAERPSSTFFSVRKSNVREPSRSPSVAERANSLTRHQTPSPPDSRESSPGTSRLGPRDRAGSMATRLSVFEGGNLPRGQPESIQVTARIVRDPGQPFPTVLEPGSDPSDLTPLDLKQSPLLVDHQKPTAATIEAFAPQEPSERKETIQERRMSREKRRSQSQDRDTIMDDRDGPEGRPRRRSSLSIVKDFIKDRRDSILGARSPSTDNLHLASPASIMTPAKSPSRPPSVHATAGLVRRLSISSRRSSTSKDRDVSTPPLPTPLSPSLMTETSGSGDESRSSPREPGHKKTGSGSKSRASRFMRRLSSSLSSGRKTITPTISPTVAEEDEMGSNAVPSSRGSSAPHGPTIVSYMGDVNVQFPDNLLWKRRTMCLDSQGFLILSAVQGVTATTTAAAVAGKEKQAGAIKRYHLSDFRSPYTPEMEVQELPNSVCLDFVDGSGLQIACEDRAGQLNILHVLQDAHQGHTSFGQ